MANSYFRALSPPEVANHILCLYSAKAFARLSASNFGIDVRKEEANSGVYICNSTASMTKQEQVMPPSYSVER